MFTSRSKASVLLALSLAAVACGGGSSGNDGGGTTTPVPPVTPTASQYVNPVLNADFPDPGIVRGTDGAYYAYATQPTGIHIQVARSTDLVAWSTPSEALPVKPAWASQSQNFWAPDVNYRTDVSGGSYVMYFSAQADSTNGGFCVGMATSPNPAGPFTDVGHPVVCGRDGFNIDPQGFDDPQTNTRYLLWGSGASIQMQQLSATDRSVFAAGSSSATTAQRRPADPYESVLVEGAWMQYHAPYYYLFYSAGNCCNQFGTPHYAVMVARAQSPTGPFEFYRASDGTSIPVVAAGTSSRFVAPGHNSVVTVNGTDYMVYHAIDTNNPILAGTSTTSRRPLLVDKITYQSNGWPIVGTTGVPTSVPQTKPGQ